jgi:hypothetical protein
MKRAVLALVFVIGIVTPAGVALADKPANPNCWGVVVAQRAVAEGDIGEHSSSQDVPRLGLGNFARLLNDLGLTAGPHISDTGTVAAELDGLDSTECP